MSSQPSAQVRTKTTAATQTLLISAMNGMASRRRPAAAVFPIIFMLSSLLEGLCCRRGAARRSREQCGSCGRRSEEHTSELQSLMPISYAVFCLNKTTPLLLSIQHFVYSNEYTCYHTTT